ncbi:MAG: hypothetical protein HeimC3_37580 [Candidatus Heimdallarchaeota archaeon LC_3]|nr:MAG: hypothetical protein HeimC3_37580 [Candidatus Heimdallarchaeota archaeon LC_3]
MVLAEIRFDKADYQPGDRVKATFFIDMTKIPERVQKLVILLCSGETTKFHKPSDETLYRGEHVYSQSIKEFPFDDLKHLTLLEETLEYELPSFPIFPIKYQDLSVFHQAQVRFESDSGKVFMRRSPPPITKNIPYRINENILQKKAIETEKNGLRIKLSSNVFVSGDNLEIIVQMLNPINHKEIRIELLRKTKIISRSKSRSEEFRNLLLKVKRLEDFPKKFIVPSSLFHSDSGNLYDFTFMLKIIIVKNILQKKSVEIPIQYAKDPNRPIQSLDYCENCGTEVENVSSCPNCNATIVKSRNKTSFKVRNNSSLLLSDHERSRGWKE